MARKRIREHELPELMRTLDEGTSAERCRALRRLCPCENRVFSRQVWQRIFAALETGDTNVRREAAHAIGTLKQLARHDSRAGECLTMLERKLSARSRDYLLQLDFEHLEQHLKIGIFNEDGDRLELPKVIQALDHGTSEEKIKALRMLCPCRNRVYDREVWRRIFGSRKSDDSEVGHQAEHAIGTLRDRAHRDPRSWELLLNLEQDPAIGMPGGAGSISLWGPRSRPSRRKRMTRCKSGRIKALASLQFLQSNGQADELFS